MVNRQSNRLGLKLYVEGGGDTEDLKAQCREGFAQFLQKAGLKGKMPRVVASGSRRNAFENFAQALKEGSPAMLLVDSEAPLSSASKWTHVLHRDGDRWEKPSQAKEEDLYFMVQCMESWLISDLETLSTFFGDGFQEKALPAAARRKNVEDIAKTEVYESLKKATKGCAAKGQYGKGAHSFKLLGLIDPQKVEHASAQAKQFLTALRQRMA